jgi:hypothetical protein
MSLNLTEEHVKARKRVGAVGTNPVFEIVTTGGLWMNVMGKGGKFDVISTGPHRAVARYIAEQREPNLVWNTLSKADFIPFEDFAHLVPKYQALTDAFVAASKE